MKKVLRFKCTCALFVGTRSLCQVLASLACLCSVSISVNMHYFSPSIRVREVFVEIS
jgi:hypothetical protein